MTNPEGKYQQAAFCSTMFAYAGTYFVVGDKVIHHVELSWNEVWSGTDQVRSFEIEGKQLSITSRFVQPESEAEAEYTLTWEKVISPH